ncbi:MAG: hypothetical protein LBK76_06785 [Verrucomicrobiales bacterium]|jgi:hypothetical protein|nr:hypothetical protein [Verrucomicrobiales bacterium]
MNTDHAQTDLARQNSLEGKTFQPADRQELARHMQEAFDYRGDVTLLLNDDTTVSGYVFNFDEPRAQVQIFVKGEGKDSFPRTVDYHQVTGVTFSGADMAFGKSWDTWQAKSEKQRAAEAEHARQESLARGEL